MGIEGNTDNGLERTENTADFSKTEVQEFIDQMPDEISRKHENVTLPDEITRQEIKTEAESLEDKIKKQDEIIAKVESGDIKLETTQEKGNYGEMKTDQRLRELGYERISKKMVTSLDDPGHKGLDGVYKKENPDGSVSYLIVDAKYGTAQLSMTRHGKQMSLNWIVDGLESEFGKEEADNILLNDPDALLAHIDEDWNITFIPLDEDGNPLEEDK